MRKLVPLLAVAGLSLLPVVPAAAAAPPDQAPNTRVVHRSPARTTASAVTSGNGEVVADAASWLAAQVTPAGYVESAYTPGTADIGTTEQAVVALAAAGVGSAQVDAMESYLAAHLDEAVQSSGVDSPGRLALVILGAVATGRDPHSFGGTDLVSRLQATRQPSGLYGAAPATYDGAFRQGVALLALAAAAVPADSGAVSWLTDQQCSNGGWQSLRADTSVPCPATDAATFSGPDSNSTAAAMLGLAAVGVTPPHDPAAWLDTQRSADGGWASFAGPGVASDANSTGLVLQALLVARGSVDPAGAALLSSLQVPCASQAADRGGIAFQASPGSPLVADALATSQALWGLAGQPFPLVRVPVAAATAPCRSTVDTTTTTVAPALTVADPGTAAPAAAGPADVSGAELPRTGGGALGLSDARLAVVGSVMLLAGLCLLASTRRRTARG